MATAVSFEAGVIADAMKKAAAVAPSKVGSSFDKAAGIILDISPGGQSPCVVRATDTEVFYIETLDVVHAEGDKVRWRLPSQLLANVVGTVPSTSGKVVKFTQETTSQVDITSGRMRARMVLNANPHYPEWYPYEGSNLVSAPNFGANLGRVEWAASKSGPPPLNGILIDGEYLVATDRYKVARVPCKVDLQSGPIIVPAWGITSLLKTMSDVQIGTEGSFFLAMPDNFTQIKTISLGVEFPKLEKITSLAYEEQVQVPKTDLIDKLQKAASYAGANRSPKVTLFVGREEVAVMMSNDEMGLFGDVIEVPGQADHARIQIFFSPKMLLDPLVNAPNDKVTIKYNPSNTMRPICIDGDSGYEVWVAPRSEKTPDE